MFGIMIMKSVTPCEKKNSFLAKIFLSKRPEQDKQDKEVDEESEQSFPASDPPSWSGSKSGPPQSDKPKKQ